MAAPAINLTACQFRHVRGSLPAPACDRCQRPAPRVGEATRTAIAIALDHPVLLLVTVSVHRCLPCPHAFRAPPPLLRKDAVYSSRVVTKAVQSVVADGMAFRRVATRLARDFWVPPSAGMIRQWCSAYAGSLDFVGDDQPWVVSEVSGVLCVDEVSQDQVARRLAVAPAAPDGDRLIGDQLVHGTVSPPDSADFLGRLQHAGIAPAPVITDGSPLYPRTIAAIWPHAGHQRCLFQQTRPVTKAAREVRKAVRAQLPALPPGSRLAADPRDAAPRHAPTTEAMDHPAVVTPPRRGRGRCRRAVRQEGLARVHALRRQGGAVQGIARQTGISRPTVRSGLGQPDPGGEDGAGVPVVAQRLDLVLPPEPPPAPWVSGEQVQHVRQGVGVDRFRFVCRPDHRTADDHAACATRFASPVGSPLRRARAFLEDWYASWRDETGARRSRAAARERYEHWQTNPDSATVPALRKLPRQIDAEQFAHLSHFLRDPTWEGTNNAAERGGRAFRHRQGPHCNLRGATTIEHALRAEAFQRTRAATSLTPAIAARSTRGRPIRQPIRDVAA